MTDANKRFAELAGCDKPQHRSICPTCGKTADPKVRYLSNDFTDTREVLKVMMAREDWIDFRDFNLCISGDYIECVLILDHTGKLRDLAIEWMEKEGK